MRTKSKVIYEIVGPDDDPVVWRDHIGGQPVVFKQAKTCARFLMDYANNWESATWSVRVTNIETQETTITDAFEYDIEDITICLNIAKERVIA